MRDSLSSKTSGAPYPGPPIAWAGHACERRGMAKKALDPALVAMGRRIREAAKATGRTFADVAKDVGVQPHTLDRYMRGDTDPARKLYDISRVTGRSVEWLRGDAGAPLRDEVQETIEAFIHEDGARLKPPLSAAEARHVRTWPHRKVTRGRLLDMVLDLRRGMDADDIAAAETATEEARARGAALGVPARRAR